MLRTQVAGSCFYEWRTSQHVAKVLPGKPGVGYKHRCRSRSFRRHQMYNTGRRLRAMGHGQRVEETVGLDLDMYLSAQWVRSLPMPVRRVRVTCDGRRRSVAEPPGVVQANAVQIQSAENHGM